MALRFKKEQHGLISEALRAYIRHLEFIELDRLDYIGELRNFLGKLLRENDWSYILWNSPKNGVAGNLKIIKSSCTEFPRNSKWTLYQNGKLRVASIFKSKELNLIAHLVEIKTISEQEETTFRLLLGLKSNEFVEIETSSSVLAVLKDLEAIIKNPAFGRRTTPSLIMLDAIQFYLESKKHDSHTTQVLLKVRGQLIEESYGIKPDYIKRNVMPTTESGDSNEIKLKISEDSLVLLENILSEYCKIVETCLPPEEINYDKLDKARRLTEKFRQSIK